MTLKKLAFLEALLMLDMDSNLNLISKKKLATILETKNNLLKI